MRVNGIFAGFYVVMGCQRQIHSFSTSLVSLYHPSSLIAPFRADVDFC